ncbi:MAG: DUF1929 domain-containing protein [Solirubrobacteraceae bacterium]|nr:DUF1929 domain-containing protein [Solirubrobacteraceae bacterium]
MVARLSLIASTVVLGALALATGAHAADPAQEGRWSAVQTYPLTPISAAVMPNGNIVAWDQADPNPRHTISPNSGKAIVIDPDVGVIARSVNLAPTSVFCPLITTLPDGKVAIVGGGGNSDNSDRTVLFDPVSNTFGAWGSMSRGRWYPGGNIDKNSNIVTIGGRGGNGVDVIDAATGASRRLNVGFGDTWYPHVLRAPDGRFVIENISQTDAPTRQWLDLNGAGSLTNIADKSLLQSRRRLTSTMVGPYSTLMITGGLLTSTYVVDLSSGTPVVRSTGQTKYPHMTGTSVTLPDGHALVIGGNSSNNETQGTPVLTPELWSPATGQWASMADSPKRRLYHSVAALLPDGRVWSAGTSAYGQDEYNGAYFTPPNLFKKDGSGELAPRPQVAEAPRSAAWGERFSVRSPDAASIRGAALIRMAATTHQYGFDQTYVPLDVTREGDRLSMTVPENGNTIPAGQYMLFLVDGNGVPSKAPVIEIKPTAATPPAPIATQSTLYTSAWGQPYRAFDGSTANTAGGQFAGNHTNLQVEPWWQVDLGRSRDLERLTLYNRTDNYGSRLREAWVFTSDVPFTSMSVAATRTQPGVTATQITKTPGATVEVPVNRSARYIRIQLPRNDYLHLREVVPTYRTSAPQLAVTKLSESDTQTTVKVANAGNAAGTITSVTLPGAGWAQTGGASTPLTIAPGGETTLTLTRGSVDGNLVLAQEGGANLSLALSKAHVPAPAFSLEKTEQTDGEVKVRISNTGDAAGTIESITLPGAGWAQVAGPGTPLNIGAGGSVQITLTRGTVDGDLVVTPSTGTALRLALTRTPPPLSPQLAIAKQSETNSTTTVTVTNTGTGPGTVSSMTLPGAGWSSGSGAPFTVAAGASATLVLQRGTVDGNLVLTQSAGADLVLSLTKAVVPVGSPVYAVSPAGALDFTARLGRAGTVITVTLRNTGTAPGSAGPLGLSAATPDANFGITATTCGARNSTGRTVTTPVVLAPGASCTVTIGFRSTGLLPVYGSLIVPSGTITLTGRSRLF